MSTTRNINVHMSAQFYGDWGKPTTYGEHMSFPIPKGLDHIEALAILVTELVHFERALSSALATGIREDAVPETGG